MLLTLFCLSGCAPSSESEVVVCTTLDQEFSEPILDAFERSTDGQTGVVAKFGVDSTKTVGLVNRMIAEKDAPTCDVFWNNEILQTVKLQKMGLLQPRTWDVSGQWPTNMIASDGSWCGFAARARVLIVNTEKIADPDDGPSSVADLMDPRWQGQCAMARPLSGTTATHFAVLRQRDGRDETLRNLDLIRNNAVILSGNKQVALAVSAGNVAWGLTDTDDAILEKDRGSPVRIIFPDQSPEQPGTLRIPNTVAVLKGSPHPVAASRLADYLTRPEIEDRFAMGDSSQLPVSTASKYTPRVLPKAPVRWMEADFEAAAEDWQDWAEAVQQIFVSTYER